MPPAKKTDTSARNNNNPDDGQLLEAADAFEQKYAEPIARREAAGLTRAQAIECQRAQVRHDLEQAKAAAKK